MWPALPVAVVSEGLAERLWPGQDAIGGSLRVAVEGRTETATVVGVAKEAVVLGRLRHIDDTRPFDSLRSTVYRSRPEGDSRQASGLLVRVP